MSFLCHLFTHHDVLQNLHVICSFYIVGMIDLALSQIPFKRLTQPLDIAKFIASQATSDEAWNTGNIINLDGGECVVAFHTPLKK